MRKVRKFKLNKKAKKDLVEISQLVGGLVGIIYLIVLIIVTASSCSNSKDCVTRDIIVTTSWTAIVIGLIGWFVYWYINNMEEVE